MLVASAAVAVGSLWYATRDVIHGDAAANGKDVVQKAAALGGISLEDGSLSTLVWGSNRYVSRPLMHKHVTEWEYAGNILSLQTLK